MFSSERVICGVDDWPMQWVLVLVELQMMATFRVFIFVFVLAVSVEAGGCGGGWRKMRRWKIQILQIEMFIHVFADLWGQKFWRNTVWTKVYVLNSTREVINMLYMNTILKTRWSFS